VRTPLRALTALSVAVPVALLVCGPTFAAGKGRNRTADTAAPSVAISTPATGSTTGTSLTVTGTASDNVGVSSVSLQVDGGGWQPASGTTSWSVPLAGFTAGTHTVTAKAADAAGNTRTASSTFTVSATATPPPSPSPSPTQPAPSPSPSPTQPAPSPTPTSPTPSPTGTTSTGPAPDTQGTWTSPEGAHISVSTAGPWTVAKVYALLLGASAGPGDFSQVAPGVTVNVQDTYSDGATGGPVGDNGNYTGYNGIIWLKGTGSTFASNPDAQMSHEYGHIWTMRQLYMSHGGDWASYLGKRWSSSTGSVLLGQDSRLNSNYMWSVNEVIADDYRLLFGNSAAQSLAHMNYQLVDPRQQPGLRDWFLTSW
jgi:hypothetical protein